jgi:NAD(P)-dependent dehydrogenase (short-subunit alcohol dehydrogenase family)
MLKNKVILVTGGAGLLGRDFCFEISKQGGFAVVADINLANAEIVANEIISTGGKAEAVALDITDTDSVVSVIDQLNNRHGRIDALVNNAYPRNKSYGRKLDEVTYADFCENVSMHLGGYFLVSQKFSLYFKANGGGSIVNIASIYGFMAPRFEVYDNTHMTMPVEYAAIKSSIIHLTRYFAQYFKHDGIRCNSLSPGGILDKQPESFLESYKSFCGTKGMLNSSDILGTLIFLLSDSSKYLTGQNLIVDDGFSL